MQQRNILLVIAFLIFVVSLYLIYKDVKSKTIKDFNNEQLVLAKTASQGITTFFVNYQSDLVFLSQINHIQNANEEGNELISSFFEKHKGFVTAITRVDEKGIIQYSYPFNKNLIGRDISYQKHVKKIITTHKLVISDVFWATQGYLAIAVHAPIFKNKIYVGSIAMLIPMDALGKLYLGKINNKKKGHAWLLSENGIEIYCPVKNHTGKSFLETTHHNRTSLEVLNSIRSENSGTGKCEHQDKLSGSENSSENMFFAFYRVPIENTFWTILISYQESDVYLALASLRNRLILIFTILIFVITYYFYSLVKVQNFLKVEAQKIKAETDLLISEEKFRKLFEDHTAVKLIIDPDSGKIVDANKAAAEYYGWSRESFKQMKISQINPMPPAQIRKCIEIVLSEKRNQFEFKHILKNGDVRDVEVFSSKISIGKKELIHSIVHDITDRKQAEQEKVRLLNIIECSLNEIYVFDTIDLNYIYANKGALDNMGYSLDEITTLFPYSFKMGYSRGTFMELIHPLIIHAKDRLVFQTNHIRKDGSMYPVEVFLQIVENFNQEVFLEVIIDITERSKTELLIKEKTDEIEAQNEKYAQINEELSKINQELHAAKDRAEESDRLKTAFLQNMSHEIRTPLNAIMGFSGLLPHNFDSKSKLEYYSSVIQRRCNDLLSIINDILDIAKIESDQLTLYNKDCHVFALLSEIKTFFQEHQKQQSKQHIEFTFNDGGIDKNLSIYIDGIKLKQILINLISNAFKFTDQGKIDFGCKYDQDNRLVFYVSDTGIGIPNTKQAYIFERFTQLQQTQSHLYGGTGLGLPIVKGLIVLMGGTIWLESEIGVGSTFYFTFPQTEKHPNAHSLGL